MPTQKKPMSALKALLNGKTAGDLAPDVSSLIPKGIYKARIEAVEERTSQKGHVYAMIKLRLEGNKNYDGQVVLDNLNLGNPNAEVVARAEGAMNTLFATAGFVDVDKEDAFDLLMSLAGCSTEFYLSQQAARNGYPARNNVAKYISPAESAVRAALAAA